MRPNVHKLLILSLGAVLGTGMLGAFAAGRAPVGTLAPLRKHHKRPLYVPDTVLVTFKKTASRSARIKSVSDHGLEAVPNNSPHFAKLKLSSKTRSAGGSVESAIAKLKQDPNVEIAEPDYYVYPASLPNDGYFGLQWNLRNVGQLGINSRVAGTPGADINVSPAWDKIVGSRFTSVAVVDTGVLYTHPDLAFNCQVLAGSDLTSTPPGNDPNDSNGHGTRVAGIIGALQNNTVGISGVCPVVRMIPVKIFTGGPSVDTAAAVSTAAAGVDFATAQRPTAINASWTLSSGVSSAILGSAIQRANTAGVLFITAAGNDFGGNNDITPVFPASYSGIIPNVISVAASDRNDELASFSNFGAATVDVAAPGDEIFTTILNGDWTSPQAPVSGSSFAAAHVTGAAALVKSLFPSLTMAQLKARLLGNTDYPIGLKGFVRNGRLNVLNAMNTDSIAPGAPTSLVGSLHGATSVVLRFVSSGDDGAAGTAISYDFRYSTSPITAFNFASATPVLTPTGGYIPAPLPSGTVQQAVVTGLTPGTTYFFAIRSTDKGGNVSPITSSAGVSTVAALAAPRYLDDVEAGPQFVGTVVSGSVASTWARTAETAHSGSWSYSDSPFDPVNDPTGVYTASSDTALTQINPVFIDAMQPKLSFWANYNLELNKDLVAVEASPDGGVTWYLLPLSTLSGGITGNSFGQWVQFSVALDALIGTSVKFRFEMVTDGSNQFDGIHIDDIQITGNSVATFGELDNADGAPDFSGGNWKASADLAGTTTTTPDHFDGGRAYSDSPVPIAVPPATQQTTETPYLAIGTTTMQQSSITSLAGYLPLLQFWAKLDLAAGDNLFVDSSFDSGAHWKNIGGFSGTSASGAWGFVNAYLYSHIGDNIKLRFRLVATSGNANKQDGAHVDVIEIFGEPLTSVGGVTIPNAPTNLSVVPGSLTSLILSWTDNSNNELGFRVERFDPASGYKEIGVTAADQTTFIDTGLDPNTSYQYRVRATNSAGDSGYAGPATGVTSVPQDPTTLTGQVQTSTSIRLTWRDNSDREGDSNGIGFRIERSADEGFTWTQAGTMPPAPGSGTTVIFTDTGLTPNTTYEYRVISTNRAGDSNYTNVVTVRTAVPSPAANLTATAASSTSATLNWTDASNDETGFKIQRSTDNFANPVNTTTVTTTGANATSFTDGGLTAGNTYYYRVIATNLVGDGIPSNVASVRLLAPNAPSGLSLVVQSSSQIQLNWTDNSNDETGFKVERSTNNFASFTSVTTTAANAVSFTDTGLTGNTLYYYRVRATNAVGDSGPSNIATGTTGLVAPNSATNLTAVIQSPSAVLLSWTDNSGNETGFRIERKTDLTDYTTLTTTAVNATSFTDSTVVLGQAYTYRVIATNSGSDAAPSNEARVSMTVPAAATNLQGFAVSGTQIKLTWSDNSADETGFKIERSLDNFANPLQTVLVNTTAANTSQFFDTGLTAGTTYYYRVKATNSVGDAAPSNVVSVVPANPPNAPTNFTAVALSTNTVQLDWTDNSTDELGFKIERRVGSGPYGEIAVVAANVVTYKDSGLQPGTTYTYRMYAYGLGSPSPYTPETTVTTPAVPGAPSNLVAVALSGSEVQLTWTDNSNNETGFRIERKLVGGAFTEIKVLSAGTTSFVDAGLTVSTTYTYQVRAYNSAGNSAYSNQATVTTPTTLAAPSNLTAQAQTNNRVALRWTDNSSNEKGFRIERRLGSGAYREIAVVGLNVTTYTDKGLSAGSTYTYRVRAYNGSGTSPYSNEASAVAIRSGKRGKNGRGR